MAKKKEEKETFFPQKEEEKPKENEIVEHDETFVVLCNPDLIEVKK
jgi:hypothetical protein